MQNLNFTATLNSMPRSAPVGKQPLAQDLELADEASQKLEAAAQAQIRIQWLRSFEADSDCV